MSWSDVPMYRCRDCSRRNHRHATYRVGPYLICRCLACPVLVVGQA